MSFLLPWVALSTRVSVLIAVLEKWGRNPRGKNVLRKSKGQYVS
jgi:hypothetical protein